ncbi:MAG: cytochrome C [Deltaproteobacteria bacterium RIFOXYD12_FULL_55_16]|nr:MAG: cytochrome C [Deltaproteobacteria bacterium RIFOXYD12_FULL_55_16]
MNLRLKIIRRVLPVLLLLPLTAYGASAPKKGDFKLLPGASGKICLGCHVDLPDKIAKKFVHTPVKSGDCAGCHNPHTSDHGKLLAAAKGEICSLCHSSMIVKDARSTHKVVVDGSCALCHDAHASDNKNNLLRSGKELCFGCHQSVADALKSQKFPHKPVADCTACHNPHSSKGGDFLLSADPPALCSKCHDTAGKKFSAVHMGYPVAQVSCVKCHDPHGSNRKAILYDEVHSPVAKKMCNQCHEEATSATPLALKRKGFELCRGCHNELVNKIFIAERIHWPVAGGNGCLDCHDPHASRASKLIKGSMLKVCGSCHSDTIKRQERSPAKHQPVQKGECAACHNPHASSNPFLLKEPSVIAMCGTCHEWMKHSTHPIGDKYNDMRNSNLKMDCLSCHRSHGTEFAKMIPFPTVTNLCVQCHEQLRR